MNRAAGALLALVAMTVPVLCICASSCSAAVDTLNVTRDGDDFASVQLLDSDTLTDCIALCCFTSNCAAFSFNQPQPEPVCLGGTCCATGSTCCMLKNAVPPPVPNTYGPGVRTGVVSVPLLPAPTPPLPFSTLVTAVSFSDVAWWGGGNSTGDTWPSAWAADGSVLAIACDFDAQPFTPMAVYRVEGDPYGGGGGEGAGEGGAADPPAPLTPQLVAWDPIPWQTLCAAYGPTGAYPHINTKPAGMLALPNPAGGPNASTLYLGTSCINFGTDPAFTRQTNLGGFLMSSTDGGATWSNVTEVGAFPGRFAAPVLLSCGKANDACASLDGGALYVFFPGSFNDASYWDNNDAMFLARTTAAHIAAPAQYVYYVGTDGAGEPAWDTDPSRAAPVLTYPSMVGDNAVSYNPFLQRYVMGNYGFLDPSGRPRPWHSKPYMSPHRTQLLLLEAPHPWGPWSVFYRSDDSPQAPGLYTPTFPSAYMRPLVPGTTPGTSTADMLMFFSCLGGASACRYTLNYQIVTVTVQNTPPAPVAPTSSPSSSDLNCFFNGVYNHASSTCACLPGWAPPDCRTLALLPAPALTAASQVYYHPSNAGSEGGGFIDNSWGIRLLPGDGDGLLHGFMTELDGNCSLSSYGTASRVLHVTAPADAPGGASWAVSDVALDHFAHNPAVVRDVDGAWLLYHIGVAQPECGVSCASGKPVANGSCASAGHGSSVARATSPYGPWERLSFILPDNETNPSPLVLPDGTIVLTARRWTDGVPLYVSNTGWRGPYVKSVLNVTTVQAASEPTPTTSTTSSNTPFFDEDPHLYVNSLGYAHMLTHREPGGTCSATGPTPDDCRCAGGHLFAPSLWGPWFVDATTSLYNCSLQLEGGGSTRLHARQRPFLYFPGPQGSGNASACPLLFTGSSSDSVSQYASSFTMVQAAAC